MNNEIPCKFFFVFFVIIAAVSLGDCTTVVVETAQAAFEDRMSEDQIIDAKIKTGIVKRLTNRDKGVILDISTVSSAEKIPKQKRLPRKAASASSLTISGLKPKSRQSCLAHQT